MRASAKWGGHALTANKAPSVRATLGRKHAPVHGHSDPLAAHSINAVRSGADSQSAGGQNLQLAPVKVQAIRTSVPAKVRRKLHSRRRVRECPSSVRQGVPYIQTHVPLRCPAAATTTMTASFCCQLGPAQTHGPPVQPRTQPKAHGNAHMPPTTQKHRSMQLSSARCTCMHADGRCQRHRASAQP